MPNNQHIQPIQHTQPIQEYTLQFGRFEFFEDYVISIINEGVDMDSGSLLAFHSLCFEVFQGRTFSIVELRVFSYSVDPSFYIEYRDLLSCITSQAVVIDVDSAAVFNGYEALYMKHCPCRLFDSLTEAVNWIHSVSAQ